MILYHFCCARDMKGIRSKGITKGVVYGQTRINQPNTPGKWQPYWMPMWQWLTLDPDRNRQSWNTHHIIRYDRTEYRWTVDVPEEFEDMLYDRDWMDKKHPGTAALFDG